MGDPDDTPLNTQSNLRSNWRHWAKYCAAVSPNVNPWRPNIAKSSTPSGESASESSGLPASSGSTGTP